MRTIGAILLGVLCSVAWAGEIAQTDGNGRITALDAGGDPMAIRTDIRIPLAGWARIPSLGTARDVKTSEAAGMRTWTGTIEVDRGKPYRYEETLSEDGGTVRLSCRVTALADVKIEGVYFWLDLPIPVFGGGTCDLTLGNAPPKSAQMPPARPASRHFLAATADRLTATAPSGKPVLDLSLDPACSISVQDNREWNTPTYSALIRFPGGQLAAGQTAALTARLKLNAEGDHSPAVLTLDPAKARYRLDGFGGNYCFNIESPVSHYTLDNLRVAWARTEMTLPEWEPTNDNASPDDTDWAFLASHDQPDTNLRREFLLAQKIQKKGIPYSITIWHLPEWLYTDPGKGPNAHGRHVAADKWPELLESIGSYLVYARKQYGVEPDLFSFNEPDGGVRVKLSAEEHRDAIKRIGAHLAGLGLRTKMLLADVTNPRGTQTYALPTAADPEALRYVGALAFHSWGGASPAQYAAWADLADRLKLPLLVAELGVDAGAWRGKAYHSFSYGLREVRMYQELVLYARPRGTMQWEFTGDYATVDVQQDPATNRVELVPTQRFWFVKHFCNLTPPAASVLAVASDNPKVLLTAFSAEADGRTVYTLHVANLGGERPATIAGLPDGVKSLRAVRTSAAESFKELPPVAVEGGLVKLTLAQQSLLTLTTLPPQ